MLIEHVVQFLLLFATSAYIARQLGPESFGIISYCLSVIAIAGAISKLGLDNLLVNDFAQGNNSVGEVIISGGLASVIGLGLAFALLAVFWINIAADQLIFSYTLVLSFILIFGCFNVIVYMFQGLGLAKYSSIAKIIAIATSSCIKVYVIYNNLGLHFVIYSYAIEAMLIALFLSIALFFKRDLLTRPVVNRHLVKRLVLRSIPLVIISSATILTMKTDQLMVNFYLGSEKLGLYSSASKIFEGWAAFIMTITVSLVAFFVGIRKKSRYRFEKAYSRLVLVLFWGGVTIALATAAFSETIVMIIYGEAYLDAASSLAILMLAAPFAALNSAAMRFCVIEDIAQGLAFRAVLCLMINVLLNILVIPTYGIDGAAITSVLSLIFSGCLILKFNGELRTLKLIFIRGITLKDVF